MSNLDYSLDLVEFVRSLPRALAPTPNNLDEAHDSCVNFFRSCKLSRQDVAIKFSDSSAIVVLSPRGKKHIETFILFHLESTAALKIQKWYRKIISLNNHLLQLSNTYSLILTGQRTSPIEESNFIKLLNSDDTFELAISKRTRPTQTTSKIYAKYAPKIIEWIGSVLDIDIDGFITDILGDGSILCKISVSLFPKIICNLLDRGNEYSIHKIVFFLELCKSLGVKSTLLFSISDLITRGRKSDAELVTSAVAVMKTICAMERLARKKGWKGPEILIRSESNLDGNSPKNTENAIEIKDFERPNKREAIIRSNSADYVEKSVKRNASINSVDSSNSESPIRNSPVIPAQAVILSSPLSPDSQFSKPKRNDLNKIDGISRDLRQRAVNSPQIPPKTDLKHDSIYSLYSPPSQSTVLPPKILQVSTSKSSTPESRSSATSSTGSVKVGKYEELVLPPSASDLSRFSLDFSDFSRITPPRTMQVIQPTTIVIPTRTNSNRTEVVRDDSTQNPSSLPIRVGSINSNKSNDSLTSSPAVSSLSNYQIEKSLERTISRKTTDKRQKVIDFINSEKKFIKSMESIQNFLTSIIRRRKRVSEMANENIESYDQDTNDICTLQVIVDEIISLHSNLINSIVDSFGDNVLELSNLVMKPYLSYVCTVFNSSGVGALVKEYKEKIKDHRQGDQDLNFMVLIENVDGYKSAFYSIIENVDPKEALILKMAGLKFEVLASQMKKAL